MGLDGLSPKPPIVIVPCRKKTSIAVTNIADNQARNEDFLNQQEAHYHRVPLSPWCWCYRKNYG